MMELLVSHTHCEGTQVSNIRKTLDVGAQTHLDCTLPTAAASREQTERSLSSSLLTGKIKMYCTRGEEEVREQTELWDFHRQTNRTM